MVKRCIAAGCSNTYKQNVSLFIFPRDPTVGPGKYERRVRDGADPQRPHTYAVTTSPRTKLGFEKRKTLKPDAVPTVFPRTAEQNAAPPPSKKRAASCSTEPGLSQALKKARSSFEKRERPRVRKKSRCISFAVKNILDT